MINSFEKRPRAAEIEYEPKFRIEVVTEPDELIDHESRRVQYYLEQYSAYQRQGYADGLRFPRGTNLDNPSSEVGILKDAIWREFQQNKGLYAQFGELLSIASEQLQACIPEVERLYGFDVVGNYYVAPTAYGTNGSSAAYGAEGPVVFRIPTFRSLNLGKGFTTGKYRTPLEMLTHEILAHKVTKVIRNETTLDEFVEKASHQQHKEYLMDLLGQTVLTESGLMHVDDVAMQVRAMHTAQRDIDPLYFDPNGNLSWAGDLQGLVSRIDAILTEEK